MRHLLLVVSSLLLCLNSLAQVRTITGKVIDNGNKTVPFCLVTSKDNKVGTICDENGKFSLTINPDSVKTLVASCLGYEKKEIMAAKLPNEAAVITLKKEPMGLNEVRVQGKKGPIELRVLGKKKMRHSGDCYQRFGDEDAVFLPSYATTRGGTLIDAHIFITDEGEPDAKFRVHVYEKDSVTNLPSTELTGANIIAHANQGNEWVTVDLSSKIIPVNGGVFISIEWISGFGNVQTAFASAKHSEVSDHNGQVLGLTFNNYGIKYMYHRSLLDQKWRFHYVPYLCPMIYCTYKYMK